MSSELTFIQLKLQPDEFAVLDRYCLDQGRPTSRMKGANQIAREALRSHFWNREANHAVAQ